MKNNSSLATKIFSFLGLTLGFAYFAGYVWDIKGMWFNPEWTTDDALQQVYPFHKVVDPALFPGDLVTEVMKGYLAPIHYWLSYGITYLTGDPIMMSHWVMLIQIVTTLLFAVLIAKEFSNWGVAGFVLFWLTHTRTFMQRITGGLPRGWAPVILTVFLYLLIKGKHKLILFWILVGCLLNPPATMIVAFTYGFFLTFQTLRKSTRAEYQKRFITLLVLAPIYAIITLSVVHRPEEVGQMVTYEQALKMPGMNRPHGRFPFVPLLPVETELSQYAFQPFAHRLMIPPQFVKDNFYVDYKAIRSVAPEIFLALFLLLYIFAIKRKKTLPLSFNLYFAAIVTVYTLARLFAFNFYVPDRHLQQPLTIFWVLSVTYLVWVCFSDNGRAKAKTYVAFFCLLLLIGFFNGHGFYGDSNFNYSKYKKGAVYPWIAKNLPKDALVAGHPQHLDPLMLFGKRTGYITYETSHPFYPKYFKETLRRNKISLDAHYATDLETVYQLLSADQVDYFVFNKTRFYPDKLKKEKYFDPLRSHVKDLTSKDPNSYAYKQIPKEVDPAKTPYLLFRDYQSVLIDVNKLGEFLKASKQ